MILSATAISYGTFDSTEKTKTFSNLEQGIYYVKAIKFPAGVKSVENSVVALPYFDKNNWVYTIAPINLATKVADDAPTTEKEITNSTKDNVNFTDVSLGDTINFALYNTTTGSASIKLTTYAVYDNMSAGLTFDKNSVKVYLADKNKATNAMELAGQKLDDEEARTLMKLQKKGLGTDATRVPTVKALFAREYITKKGKTIYPTQKGEFIINTLPVEEMKSADLTGELEKELNDIAESRTDYQQFVDKVKSLTQRWYKTVCGSSSDTFVDKSMICPSCRKRLVKGKTNVFCTGYKSGCNFSIPYSICGKKLTDNQIQMLISSQRTNIIKGFTSKKGKQFDASLKIDNYGKIEFVFPSSKKGKKK